MIKFSDIFYTFMRVRWTLNKVNYILFLSILWTTKMQSTRNSNNKLFTYNVQNTLLSNNCIIMTFIVSSHGICFGLPSKNTLNPFSNVRKNDFFIGLSRFIMTPYCIMWSFMWFKGIRISHSRCSLITKRKECVLNVTIVNFPCREDKIEYQN